MTRLFQTLYVPSRTGVTTVIEPGKVFKRIARNELPGQIMASRAVAGRALFLRTDAAPYWIEEKATTTTP